MNGSIDRLFFYPIIIISTVSKMASFPYLSVLEIVLLVLFVFLFLIPVDIPKPVGFFLDSSLGMIFLFVIAVLLFAFMNPVLGIVFLLVSYELIRRSSLVVKQVPIISYTPSQEKKNERMQQLNPSSYTTLEEEMVANRLPSPDLAGSGSVLETSFQPVVQTVQGSTYL